MPQETDLEEQEQREAAAAREAERKRVAELEEKNRDLELREARAQAALEESRRRPVKTEEAQPQGVTEAQWQELERLNPGRSREEIMQEANRVAGIADARLAPVRKELEETRRAAEEARAETAKLRRGRTLESVESKFYDENPGLKTHREKVEEFLDTYPDRDQVDEKVHAKRLALALDVVKGRVKEKLDSGKRRESVESTRLDVGEDRDRDERSETEFDPEDLPRGAARLMEDVHMGLLDDLRGRPSAGLEPEDTKKYWEKHRRADARGERGVVLDTAKEDRDFAFGVQKRKADR